MENNDYFDYLENITNEEDKKALREIGEEHLRISKLKCSEDIKYVEHVTFMHNIKQGIVIGLTGAITAGLMYVTMGFMKPNAGLPEPTPTTIEETEQDNRVVLTRYYTIKFGDTLSGLANSTGIPQKTIENDNNIKNANEIWKDQPLTLNYSIDPENIDYYSETIYTDGRSAYQIATEYDTDFQTLAVLNPGAIELHQDGTAKFLTDVVKVPKFINQSELTELKGISK